jgi:nitric oxide dioxygenase
MMITEKQKELVKATVPFLRDNGLILTEYFYNRMFEHHPELKNVFNMGNQKNGKQQTALAMAVLAYAEHIDSPGVLMPVLDGIGHKHVSLGIRAEHYAIVGEHLLAAIAEVVGEGASEELIGAWEAAYFQLADLMSGHEASLYRNKISQKNGWTGWRPFRVSRKEIESSEITSFYLTPSDGGNVADFQPGQFISVRLFLPELNLLQPRQYSLSCAPNGKYYRISVKRETSALVDMNGMISNHIHNTLFEGDLIDVSSPSGTFVLTDSTNPIVFVSGGIGQTPLVSMIERLIEKGDKREIVWIHGCRGVDVHAFKSQHDTWKDTGLNISKHIFYNKLDDFDLDKGYQEGWVDLSKVPGSVIADADYYLCGPKVFIEKHYNDLLTFGVKKSSIFYEEFGPQSLQLN